MNVARRIAFNTAAQVAGRTVTIALGLVSFALIARHLGPSGLGSYALVITLVTLVASFADLGLTTIGVREISADPSRTERVIGSLLTLKAGAVLVIAAALFAVIEVLPYEEDVHDALRIGLVALVATLLGGIPATLFQSRLRMDIVAAVEAATGVVAFAGTVTVIWQGRGLLAIVLVWALASVAGTTLSFALAARHATIRPRREWRLMAHLMRRALPLGLLVIAGFVHFRVDMVLLSVMKPLDDVGIYSVAYKFLEQALLLPALFMTSVFPVLTAYVARADERLRVGVQYALDFLLLVGLPITVGSFVVADAIVQLVAGDTFGDAVLPFRILTVATFFLFINALFANLLVIYDLQTRVLFLSLAAIALNVALNLVLIPPYSYVGASIATVVTEGLSTVVIAMWAIRHSGVTIDARPALRIAVAAAGMGAVVYITSSLPLALPVAAGILSYVALAYILGVVRPSELALLFGRRGEPGAV